MDDRLRGELDGVLHLMDRQILDVDGRMVAKVDDVELTEGDSGLLVTGLLCGPAALVPRFGGRLGAATLRYWHRLGVEQADRTVPYRVPLDDVERLGSAVELGIQRAGALVRQRAQEGGLVRRRLNELLQMQVYGDDGTALGGVLDVRLTPTGGAGAPVLVSGLVVGRGRPGSLLGYDRGPDQGPRLVNRIVRWMHRHSGLVGIAEVAEIDWVTDRITLARSDLDDLTPAAR